MEGANFASFFSQPCRSNKARSLSHTTDKASFTTPKILPLIWKASPVPESVVLHIDQLTRNVNEGHLREIFSNFGEVVNVELTMDRTVNLPRGYGYVEFKMRADAEKALLYMDGGQIDGNVVRARFTLPQRQKVSPPPKAVPPPPPKREAPPRENVGPDAEKDGQQRLREPSPRRKPISPRRRSPAAPRRVESPRRRPDSPPRRRVESPVRRRVGSPSRRGETPPRRRPASPPRRRSPSPMPRRHRSPARVSPRRARGSPVRKRSPLPLRRRSVLHLPVPLLDELAAHQEGHLLFAAAADHLSGGLLDRVPGQYLHAGDEDHHRDVEDPAPHTLHHLALGRVYAGFQKAVAQGGLQGEEAVVTVAAVAAPLLLEATSIHGA
ncbi:hypothetical protein ACLOJK_033054 [Asimina triloba]